MERRIVRATFEFFEDLDAQLPDERDPNGEPSTKDFQVVELFPIIEEFAVGFDALPQIIPGRPEYRVLITSGILIARIAVTGRLAVDGAIELVSLDLDATGGWE